MSASTIDYDALAQQHGGTAAPAVDYDALASQHGGAAIEGHGASGSWEEPGVISKAWNSVTAPIGSHFEGYNQETQKLHGIANGPPTPFDEQHPVKSFIRRSLAGMEADAADQLTPLFAATAGAGAAAKAPGAVGTVARTVLPVASVGFAGQGAASVVNNAPAAMHGDPNAVGQVLGGLGAIAGGAAGIGPTATAVSDSVKAKMAGPQGTVMPSAGNLPLLAQSGVEDVFRAAAPTSMNKGFRENLNVAAPDLADIARKVDVSEAKGGIINPDMRVRATVDAIRGHLDEMYQNERAPQIQRNANVPVKVGTNPNSVRGLEYLEATAGDVADSQLAAKAAKGQQLTVAEADQLAQLANQTLRSYEKMTPEGKMQLQATNPKIGGIKALDSELSSNLNDVLQSNGEAGLKGYERRYAALSAVRDQLESRMNATELKQEGAIGAVGRITRPFVKLVTEGPSGVPSASQAAVADVNIGRSLQMGLSKLKSSGITAFREPPNIPTRIPQKALPPGPIITPPPADTSGPVDYQPPAYSPTTRAERMGLLLPEQTSIPLPESTLNDRLQIMKAPYRIVRDPRTGRMRKMYVTGEK